MARITNVQLAARMDATDANVAALTDSVTKLATAVTEIARAQVAAFATPATVVDITSAPSVRTSTPVSAKSFAEGEKLAANGVDADAITVPAGKLGKGGVQTLAEARAKRANNAAKRETYLTERGTKSTAPKAQADTVDRSYFGMGGKLLATLAEAGDNGAQAEIDRRAAKRTAKK